MGMTFLVQKCADTELDSAVFRGWSFPSIYISCWLSLVYTAFHHGHHVHPVRPELAPQSILKFIF